MVMHSCAQFLFSLGEHLSGDGGGDTVIISVLQYGNNVLSRQKTNHEFRNTHHCPLVILSCDSYLIHVIYHYY
jgi:hypothetical protein